MAVCGLDKPPTSMTSLPTYHTGIEHDYATSTDEDSLSDLVDEFSGSFNSSSSLSDELFRIPGQLRHKQSRQSDEFFSDDNYVDNLMGKGFSHRRPTILKIDSASPPKNSFSMKEVANGLYAGNLHVSEDGLSSPLSSMQYQVSSKDFMTLGSLIGRGNSSTVSKAFHLGNYHIYALKSISVHEKALRSQMRMELNTFTTLNQCPSIVSFHGAFYNKSEGQITLVLEYMNRGSLQDVVDNHGPVREEYCLKRIAKQLLVGLLFVHESNHIHRDLKPGNVLLNSAGEAKLSDFGIVREVSSASSRADTFVGTRLYMSPERIKSEEYSFPSDIWAFGVTLYYAATGNVPFTNSEDSAGFIDLFQAITTDPLPKHDIEGLGFSDGFSEFLELCLNKAPEERWGAQDLLSHPYLQDVDVNTQYQWPWEVSSPSSLSVTFALYSLPARDFSDLKLVADALAHTVFKKGSGVVYERDSELCERILRGIGSSLSLEVSVVQYALEAYLPLRILKTVKHDA